MARSCSPPKTQAVRSYDRAAPPKRRKRAPKKPEGTYWTCVNERTGGTCGTHHKTGTASAGHAKRLNRTSYRLGRGRPWHPQKRG